MIVYGDSAYESTAAILLAQLRKRLDDADATDSPDLDALRTLLIQAGQLEQATQDTNNGAPPTNLTNAFARAFYSKWCGEEEVDLEPLRTALEVLDHGTNPSLSVKVPEGFAFYALYPEQYIVAAHQWSASQDTPHKRALVVGVRSIGTTLSALVGTTLESHGWQVRRLTVRPQGPPFERQVKLDGIELQGNQHALIVDEGPGLSGSSMSAVAEALARAGLPRHRIAFLPGHSGAPGQAGSEEVRQWWATTPRFVSSTQELRWNERTLSECLARRTEELIGQPAKRVEDGGGGLWRRFVFAEEADYPSIAAAFEQPKFLCRLQNGGAVLWKFMGLAVLADGETGAESAFREMQARAEEGWSPAPLAMTQGFVAIPWLKGHPLHRCDATPEFLSHAAHYIVASAKAPLSPEEQTRALDRMGEWLYWNTWESLGEEVAERTRIWSQRASEIGSRTPFSTYGDGRMSPHEWRRTEDGRFWKLDNCGHDADHTAVGRQTLTWDVAGLVVEWELTSEQTELLLGTIQQDSGLTFAPDFLRFHSLAYAAFSLGLLIMARGGSDASEQERLQRAIDFYREALLRWLE